MYEKMTDRARKVMQLANQEAQRLNHEYVGTEHLLLGLVKEGGGVAASVMQNLPGGLNRIREEVAKLVTIGPDQVTLGKLPQTPRAKKSFEYATDEANELGHNYIGTEHLLLGLLREQEGIAGQVLSQIEPSDGWIRTEVLRLLGREATNPIESLGSKMCDAYDALENSWKRASAMLACLKLADEVWVCMDGGYSLGWCRVKGIQAIAAQRSKNDDPVSIWESSLKIRIEAIGWLPLLIDKMRQRSGTLLEEVKYARARLDQLMNEEFESSDTNPVDRAPTAAIL
jgi:hypothetical protein